MLFRSIAVKNDMTGKGHGSRIINELLNQYNYIVIRISINDKFWQKFIYIECDSPMGIKILSMLENYHINIPAKDRKLHLYKLHRVCSFILVGKPYKNVANNEIKEINETYGY